MSFFLIKLKWEFDATLAWLYFLLLLFMQIHNIEPLHSFFFNYFFKTGTCQVSVTWIVWWRGLLWLIEYRTFDKLGSMWLILASFIPTCAWVRKGIALHGACASHQEIFVIVGRLLDLFFFLRVPRQQNVGILSEKVFFFFFFFFLSEGFKYIYIFLLL